MAIFSESWDALVGGENVNRWPKKTSKYCRFPWHHPLITQLNQNRTTSWGCTKWTLDERKNPWTSDISFFVSSTLCQGHFWKFLKQLNVWSVLKRTYVEIYLQILQVSIDWQFHFKHLYCMISNSNIILFRTHNNGIPIRIFKNNPAVIWICQKVKYPFCQKISRATFFLCRKNPAGFAFFACFLI